jgi:hypothetical protein
VREARHCAARLSFTLALATLLITRAPAQDVSPVSGSASETESMPVDEEVIVRGRRLSEIQFDLRRYIREFLDEVAAPARSRGYARWNRSVCVGVHNLENRAAQYIIDRISAVALDVGLEPGEPGCQPQVNIVFSTDAQQMAANMVESEPRVFRPVAGNAGMDLGREALDEFVKSDRPVRWWHVSLPIASHSGAAAIQLPQSPCFTPPRCYPWVPVAGSSHVHSGIRDDLQYAIIIVDATKLTGTTWQQIADYLAVVSLAQIEPDTDPQEFDSILNLFSNPAAYSGLTDWDLNYLHALYTFNQERITRIQGNEIVSRIARRELSAAE